MAFTFKDKRNNFFGTTTGLNNTTDPVTFDITYGTGVDTPPTAPFYLTAFNSSTAGADANREILLVTVVNSSSVGTCNVTASRGQQTGLGNVHAAVAHGSTCNVALYGTAQDLIDIQSPIKYLLGTGVLDPNVLTWTGPNGGATDYTHGADGVMAFGLNATNFACYTTPLGGLSAPYTVDIRSDVQIIGTGALSQFVGFGWADNSGNLEMQGLIDGGVATGAGYTATPGLINFFAGDFTSYGGTFSANVSSGQFQKYIQGLYPKYWRLTDDGTHRTVWCSPDGVSLFQLMQVTSSHFLTPTKIATFINSANLGLVSLSVRSVELHNTAYTGVFSDLR